MRPFAYSAPGSLEGAIAALGKTARPLAGGTDLVTLMQAGLVAPERLVAIRTLLPRGIERGADGTTLGAGTTLADIAHDKLVSSRHTALAQAALAAASPQLRNVATLGGNLLQRPRCWYFRHPDIACWLKGADVCPAREGENRNHALFGASPCVAVNPSDPAGALLALDAEIHLRGPRGERRLSLERFFALPTAGRRCETTLGDDELVLSVRLPAQPEATRSVYLKAMDRAAFSFALVGVAAAVRRSADRRHIAHARLVLNGVAPIPWRVPKAEEVLVGSEVSERLVRDAAGAAVEGAVPLRRNAWKIALARTLVTRALRAVLELEDA